MSTIEVAELLYEATLRFTGVTEFGVSLADLLAGHVAPPPSGARIDVAFDGTATGPKVKGTVTGVDYVRVRADGLFQLHIHAALKTDDEPSIAIHAEGVAIPRKDGPIADLRETVTLSASSAAFAWVNTLHAWGTGTVDLAQQIIRVKVYAS